ncbi:related to isotrichodermin C-15 hydroxylase (cytochrome P-450 monooxygenase CYP65A1) [Ramularia collo-cygni]|uniref:Related to isotrichodermin C-15 hydroxylase (Cytochrome P-450 monooxygenase CYP65A1) n=1 Tax=Ramularia collo-cygni TaxID=112498 RepID=A0A2D3V1X1_9PEZI|nr:related to isotrichodermin C-15 hydroxylase (cytochrome P-450 monooxygenase CYP65A1) [Ramularia collo-cygni]CZT15509.1 related to isotrichodermin C-15 hydroxylase (cytochrome P-450 monooxygenase CYP65A1) [Ramularia collo-cygni]
MAFASSTVVLVTVLSIVVVVLGQTMYRIIFHPLKSFPGPWLNAITELPSSLRLAKGEQHRYYYRLHRKYGPVVRVAPNELIFTTDQAWQDIYGLRNGSVMEKSPIFIGIVSPMNGCVGVGLARGKEHTRQRRALAPGLSKNALYKQEEIIQHHINALLKLLNQIHEKNNLANMADYFSFTTFDAIGDLSFSEPFGCLEQNKTTEWASAMRQVVIFASYDQAIRRVAGVDSWLRNVLLRLCMPAEATKWRMLHVQKSIEKTTQRLAKPDSSKQDMIYHLLREEDPKKALNQDEIKLNMMLYISAGSETTSITLTAWAYLICTHPEAYKILTSEIRSTFSSAQDIKVDSVMSLPYLGATINEALRLFTPGAVAMQRIVPAGGAVIDGQFVPAGTTVSVAPWAASRSPDNFADPDAFRPERWLQDREAYRSDEFAGDRLGASRPFGYGPKRCIGEDLSYLEARLIIAHVLFKFDMELDMDGKAAESNRLWSLRPDNDGIKLYQVLMKPDLWVRLSERV